MKLVTDKWDPSNPNCVFKHYFYNKVDESHIPFYKPQPYEDPSEWEEALQNKPAPGFMPVLCSGYQGVADRLKTQKRAITDFNVRLHQVNSSLDAIHQRHELETEVRALAARRRQATIGERSLALAAKVQVLRNRGYALSGDEDDLSARLQTLEREVQDPAVGAREEELWSKLIVLRGYADQLNREMDKPSGGEGERLDDETEVKAKRVSHSKRHNSARANLDRCSRTTRSRSSISRRRWSCWRRSTRAGKRAGTATDGEGSQMYEGQIQYGPRDTSATQRRCNFTG
jgi:nuclear pore complex protein Nup54